ncbi:hypothetical protein [Methylocystis bryophila]|nr:hypothetical protein [Methylocystis bryophila]BDV39538.1 hypothetical protein DSM21852_27910 [Methylocystis bryophila]
MNKRSSQRLRRLIACALPAALAVGALSMAAAPAQAQLAVDGPGLPSSVTPTPGESLWNIVSSAAIPTPVGFNSKNSQLRGYVMAFGGGTESVFSLGELNPSFGGTNLAPYISVSGGNYSLIDPNPGASGRDVSNLTQLVIGWAPAAAGPGGQSTAVTLSGLTNSAGSYDITALENLPSVQVSAGGGAYTGAPLFNFVNTSQPGSVTSQIVEFTATDGYVVTYSLAELDPAFGGSLNNILAYASTGSDFPADAIARTLSPNDSKHGRWVSNLNSVVVELASPAPVPGAGILSLGFLILLGLSARTGDIGAALRRLWA